MYIKIPTWDNDWTYTEFQTREEFKEFVLKLFKLPGEYDFDSTSLLFNEQAKHFNLTKHYCQYPEWTKDFRDYWDFEKEKCRFGVIFKNNQKTWYLPREYYMWLNFLPIYDKKKKLFDFPDVWDSQYHLALYELLAELHYKHVAVVKKRQFGSSYFHTAKMINLIWFEQGPIIKMGASQEKFINAKGSWKFLNEYRSFLNKETAWYRPMNPGQVLMWQQQIEDTDNEGRTSMRGLKGTIQGVTFDTDPTNGVGGACHSKGTKILTSAGIFKNVEDFKVGDFILGIDNKAKKVIRTFKGFDDIYEVVQKRGDSYECTGEHLLYLNNRDSKVAPENKLRLTKVKDWNSLTTYQKRVFVGSKNNKILEFDNDILPPQIDPYFIGLWLGDGFRANNSIIVNKTKDYEIYDYLNTYIFNLVGEVNCNRKEEKRYNDEMYTISCPISINNEDTPITKQFVKYNLYYNKHIPHDILYGNSTTRLNVLAGLIDSDGYYNVEKQMFVISAKDDSFISQIEQLCRSLGGVTHRRVVPSVEHELNERIIKYTETNELKVYFDNVTIPTKVKRKQGTRQSFKNIHCSPIENVVYKGKNEYYGIEVEDHLYYLKDLTITHNCTLFFMEEAGIQRTMDTTVEYLFPAMELGDITTGLFVAAGSVGELDDCDPLRKMIYKPTENQIYPVTSDLIDENRTIGEHGMFIPEQWSMPPYIDQYGNSLVEQAFNALTEKYEEWRRDLSPEIARLRISQHPRFLSEAFDYREDSVFPTHLVKAQKRRIEDKEYPYHLVDLIYNEHGKVESVPTTKLPIAEFPYSMKAEDKSGSIVVWEPPMKDAPWGTYFASIDPVSEGKAEYINNNLITPYGKKRIGDIKIGDFIIGVDGKSHTVTNIYPQGIKKLYRISFNDGFSVLVCEEHLWSVASNGGEKQNNHVISVKDMLDTHKNISFRGEGFNQNKTYSTKSYYKNNKNQNKWRIPITKPVEFITNELPLDPYFLGLLLGDGSISQRHIGFTSADTEILDYISNIIPDDISLNHRKDYDYYISTCLNRNSITKVLRELNLQGKKSVDKFIPEIYKRAAISDRLSLLQGLLDTDGYSGNHGVEYYSVSKDLAYGVVEIVQSLGGLSKIRKKITKLGCGYIYIVRVTLPEQFLPFRLTRKLKVYKPSKTFSRYITNIEYEKEDFAVCISTDAPDHLYLTENFIVTHNTLTSKSLCSIYVYKNSLHLTEIKNGEPTTCITRDKIVCAWCGRFDDLNDTHKRLEKIVEWYNAWTVVEANVSQFILYMIDKKKQRYLVPVDQMLFFKELSSYSSTYQSYGWKNTGTVFKSHILNYLIDYCSEVIEQETKPDGEVVRTTYGIERIPDIMAMEEMLAYRDKVNVDRIVALAALIAFAKVQQSNIGFRKMIDNQDSKKLQNQEKFSTLYKSPFRHIGGNKSNMSSPNRSPFKNYR